MPEFTFGHIALVPGENVMHAPASAAPDAPQPDEEGKYHGKALCAASAPLCSYARLRQEGVEPEEAAFLALGVPPTHNAPPGVAVAHMIRSPFLADGAPEVNCPDCLAWRSA